MTNSQLVFQKFTTMLPAPPDGGVGDSVDNWRLVVTGNDGDFDQVTRLNETNQGEGGYSYSAVVNGPVDGRMNAMLLKPVGYVLKEDEKPEEEVANKIHG